MDSHHSTPGGLSPGSRLMDHLRRGLPSKEISKGGGGEWVKSAVNLLIHLSIVAGGRGRVHTTDKKLRKEHARATEPRKISVLLFKCMMKPGLLKMKGERP